MQKRYMIYLYHYIDGKKAENCGNLRILLEEGNEGETMYRMDLHIQRIPWKEGNMHGVLVGDGAENYRCKEFLNEEVEGQVHKKMQVSSEINGGEARGIFFYDGNNLMNLICGTLRGEEMDIQKLQKKEEREEKTKELSTQNLTFPQINVENTEDYDNSVYEYDEECLKQKSEQGEEHGCEKEPEMEKMQIGEEIWQEKIFRKFPKVFVNINGERTVAVKLRPHDMVWFPGCYWRMASNKFMLNGYYHYRYLLFFKGTGRRKDKYYLGTPGEFCVNDAITAKQYGFTDFFQTAKVQDKNVFCPAPEENFGVYCQEI